jgi:hypothetical protein
VSGNPVLTAEKRRRRQRIEEFLQSGLWYVGADRPQTRRALIELWDTVPDALLYAPLAELRLLIIAPRRHTAETLTYFGLPSAPTPDAPFVVLTLDWGIEELAWPEALRAVAGLLSKALFKAGGGIEALAAVSPAWLAQGKGPVN